MDPCPDGAGPTAALGRGISPGPRPGTRRLAIQWEQFRQARCIHGGLLRLCLAALAVKLSRFPIPSPRLRGRLFRTLYARIYPPGLNEQEADRPLEAYRSLNALFTRGVKPGSRPIPSGTPEILSPCDGKVQDIGRVDQGTLLTLKGIPYSLPSLLPNLDVRPYEGGQFVIIFLSPIDCHRVFSPQDGCIEEVVHVPGSRLLVHPPFQRVEYPVYTLNERVILRLSTDVGSCVVVMVAGWGVGDITLAFAPGSQRKARRMKIRTLNPPPAVKRGDWIATFELGSTVVLITSSSHQATPLVSPNEEVRYGQPVLRYAPAPLPAPPVG
jgi:phosphatidylserine decarboxylase